MISQCILTIDYVSIIIIIINVIKEGRTQSTKCNYIDNHLVLEFRSGDDSPSYLQQSCWQLAD
jgi:hypothetical protein